MNLFEIDEKIANCFVISEGEVLDSATGEVLSIDYLNNLELEKEQKIENIAKYIINLNSDAEQLKAQKEHFATMQKRVENKRDALKEYLNSYLNGEKWKADDCSVMVSYRNSTSVLINDEQAIPEEYLIAQPPKVDKAGIKKAITNGADIKGAELITKSNIQVK